MIKGLIPQEDLKAIGSQLREAVSGGMTGLLLFDTRLKKPNKDQKLIRLTTLNSIPANGGADRHPT